MRGKPKGHNPMAKQPTRIQFTTDKHGKPIAYRHESLICHRRIGYDRAKLMIATGEAIEIPFEPSYPIYRG